MRLKIFPAVLLFLIIAVLLIGSFPGSIKGETHDPYEVPPGAPRWFHLIDFDEKGDMMDLTVVFKKTANGSFQERPVDVLIVRSSLVKRNPMKDEAIKHAIFVREKVENRVEESIENTENEQMSIVFYNEQQDGDLDNWDNATVRIRVDYQVFNIEKSESNIFLVIVFVFLVIAIVGIVVFLIYFILKRRVKDTRTFFNPDGALYYVFRDIDGSIMYFTEKQYTDMYNSHSLVTYEYLGQAMKKGGPVLTPLEEQGLYDQDAGAIQAQPMMAVPMDGQMAPQPITASPVEDGQYQDLYGKPEEVPPGDDLYGDKEQIVEGPSTDDTLLPEEPSVDGEQAKAPVEGDPVPDVLDELVAHAHTHSEEDIEEPIATMGEQTTKEEQKEE